jgi:hypothetical protein
MSKFVGVKGGYRGRLEDLVVRAGNTTLTLYVETPCVDNSSLIKSKRVIGAASDRDDIAQVEFFGVQA